jgi:hypothetical protein
MRRMSATQARDVRIGGRRYRAAAGEEVDVLPRDVERLRPFGFEPVDEDVEESTDLEDANLGELRELAKEAEIEGRSKMTREELLEALRDANTGQEA